MPIFYDTVFEAIEDFIFSRRYDAPTLEQETPPEVISPTAIAPATTMSPPLGAPPLMPLLGLIDIEAILDHAAVNKNLDWRGSISDLMTLCGVEPSPENRQSLAEELGVGDTGDEALYHAVMRELEDRGGVVSAELKDE